MNYEYTDEWLAELERRVEKLERGDRRCVHDVRLDALCPTCDLYPGEGFRLMGVEPS